MPLFWFGRDHASTPLPEQANGFPLVLFDHPCLFQHAALQSLDDAGMRWRLALTTPSLSGVGRRSDLASALPFEHRTAYRREYVSWMMGCRACRPLSSGS